jgi:WhiB family redox-sensing transcriptional regulator
VTQGPTVLTTEIAADWRDTAACAAYPNDLFFPGGDLNEADILRAKAICSVCKVTPECLQYALETNQRNGIWAETTEDERRSVRRKWLAARRRSA